MLIHVVENVMAQDRVGPIPLALAKVGITKIGELTQLDHKDIDALTYDRPESDGSVTPDVPLLLVYRKTLKSFLNFIRYQRDVEHVTYHSITDWKTITHDKFDEFCMVTSVGMDFSTSFATPTPTSSGSGLRAGDPLYNWNKGIKRDMTLFDPLKNDKDWDKWDLRFRSVAKTQGLERVLDPAFTPRGADDTALFDQQQHYMYAVFVRTLLTDKGKSIVRAHEQSSNAQKIYEELKRYALKSAQATIDSGALLEYITSSRIVDGTWKGTNQGYVLHLLEQIRKYDTLVPATDSLSDNIKLQLVQNAVHGHPSLRDVKNTALQLSQRDGKPITYQDYLDLLMSECSTVDSALAPPKTRAKRTVYTTVATDAGEDDALQTTEEYNIDSDPVTLLANAHERRELKLLEANRASMAYEKWHSISKKGQEVWDELSDADKAIILGIAPTNPNLPPRPAKPSFTRRNPSGNRSTKANLHDISAYDYIMANATELASGETTTDEDKVNDDTCTLDSPDCPAETLRAFLASRGDSASVGDLRNVLSTSSKRSDDKVRDKSTSDNTKVRDKSASTRFRKINMTRVTYSNPRHTYDDLPPPLLPRDNTAYFSDSDEEDSDDEDNIANYGEAQQAHTAETTEAEATYVVSQRETFKLGALIDRGANGGVAGADVRVIDVTSRSVNVQGISDHQLTDLKIVSCGGVTETQHGPVIAIFHQYAHVGKGKTIHASIQLEAFNLDVNEKSIKVPGGLQRIKTPDGYVHPLKVKDGLAYVNLRPYTDEEWETLPHVIWTRDQDWDPSIFDHEFDLDNEDWYDAVSDLAEEPNRQLFDQFGNYRHRSPITVEEHFQDAVEEEFLEVRDIGDIIDECIDYAHPIAANEHKVTPKEKDYGLLRRFFGWASTDAIKRTFECTTQMGRLSSAVHLKKHYRSPNPALNVHRRNEPVATDYVYADVPAIDDGSMGAQIFVGTKTQVCDAQGLKSPKQFVNALEDNIRKRGAMDQLISDRAQVEISSRVSDILRALFISSWQSEPYQQHQNPAERKYQTIKRTTNTILNRTGAPAYTWLLCLVYVCFLLNLMASEVLNWQSPLARLTGSTPDISPLLRFSFWEPVYYKIDDSDFPSDSTEARGRWVGVAEHVGHMMTYKILTDDTRKIIYRSNVRSALTKEDQNKRVDLLGGEDIKPLIKSSEDEEENQGQRKPMPVFDPSDLIGRTFLMDEREDGQRFRAKILEAIAENDAELAKQPDRIKFLVSVNNDMYEETVTYNQILDYINKNEDENGEQNIVWKFKRISGHQGPLKPDDKDYKGSTYNVIVEWETGEITAEPLGIIAADDPVTCALYAKENGLLEKTGWRRFKPIAKREGKLLRLVNQAKLKSYRRSPKYKFGFQVPNDHDEAMALDAMHGNTKWADAEEKECNCLLDYDCFIDLGKGGKPPPGYKKIKLILVYDVKHDGRHRARIVAGGHLTEIPLESVYSGVVSLRGIRMMVFLAELNVLEIWGTDISSAYLEAKTKEKLYVIAGPEFAELQGHTLVVFKALYGLRTSGVRWHERLGDCLSDMGFIPSKAEPDIWMRHKGDHYEYIGTYVDDLAIASKNPQGIIKTLEEKHHFKLKGSGPITYHLGCDFLRDDDGVLCLQPKRYIERMIETYVRFFGSKPKENVMSPLEKGDHPELDTSEFLDDDGTAKYQSMVGAMQWAISLGRIDITTAVMSLSSFRVQPRLGHLERCKRVYGYLSKMRHAMIRIRTDEPDYSAIPEMIYDWARSVYGNVKEVIPSDCPEPLGKYVTLTHYVDANLYHDVLTGRSVTGILHLLNKTPIDWYSKKQATVETATFGSEFSAARTCTEQLLDLRNTLRYLGVPIREKSYMFGDNKTVVDSSMTPTGKLHKRHTMLSYHRVREAIASGMVVFHYIPGEINPADILSKHWGFQQIWKQLQALMFQPGDTRVLFDKKMKPL